MNKAARRKGKFAVLFILATAPLAMGQGADGNYLGKLVMARVKYGGGGDWYNDPSAIPNLARFITANTRVEVAPAEAVVALTDETLFSYPVIFLTGHGRIVLSREEVERLRNYLLHGGFLYADDDYGMDSYFRQAMEAVFPDRALEEIPFSHPVYHIHFSFPKGPPKIHEHDNKAPRGFGIRDDGGRLMVYYTFESNLSDGWVDSRVHGDPPDIREKALKMGTNIILYAILH